MKSILKISMIVAVVLGVAVGAGCPVVSTGSHVIYHGNGNTGGSVPNDAYEYAQDDEVTVVGNTGNLTRSGSSFSGWNTQTDGSGTSYEAGDQFTIATQDVDLYAVWTASIRAVAAGSGFSYILEDDGSLWVTGINGAGQLGDGTTTSRSSAVKIMDGVKAVSASRFQHAMILKENGDLYAVGDNSEGQLGLPDTTDSIAIPQLVKSSIASVSCGYYYTLAIDTDGNLWATGSNGISGVLGNDSTDDSFEFVQVATDVVIASAGNRHSLFVKTNGDLYAMGDSNYGKLGRPYSSSNTYDRTPVRVAGVTDVRAVSAGMNHSLVITNSDELWSFGRQYNGQLLDSVHDESAYISTPTKVYEDIREAVAGVDKSMVITTDGDLLIAGYNSYGMLGDGTATYRKTYVTPTNVRSGVDTCSLGEGHSLIIDSDSVVYGAGSNGQGELGQGSTDAVNHYAFLEILLNDAD